MAKTLLEHLCASCLAKKASECTAEEIGEVKELIAKMWKNAEPDAIIPSDECFTCSICGEYFENEDSNNAFPVKDGRCCDLCNAKFVSPSRIKIEKDR